MTLIPLRAAATMVGCRDPRTARRRLAELGVPVVTLGRRALVDREALAAAIRARAVPDAPARAGVTLRPGERLWD